MRNTQELNITLPNDMAEAVDDDLVSIIGDFYGGRDYESRLRIDPLDR